MNQQLQILLDFLQQNENIPAEEKEALIKAAKKVKSDLEISEFKLERTEKVKRTTAILLEETIEELEQKRKAVEAQNRELEIESSLERVRTVAMGMYVSDDLLKICEVIFKELTTIGFTSLRNALIHIFNEGKDYYQDYDYADITGGKVVQVPFKGNAKVEAFFERIRKSKDAFEEVIFQGDDFEQLKMHRIATGQIDDPRLLSVKMLYYYIYSIGSGNIGISTFDKIDDQQQRILKRFRNVFDLAYKRYSDITKAEAQAREAQIEAVLERVRSRTMSMQMSDELTNVAALLFEQVAALGIKTWTTGFNVWSEDNNSYIDYITSPNGGFIEPYTVYTNKAEALKDISDARKSGIDFDVQYVEGEKIKQLYRALTGLGEKQFEKMLQDGVHFPTHQYEHFVFGSKVSLMFITYEPVTEAHDIFKRLGKVFEQTYTRFLDLKQAEAQAREAQIEAALERVRSRTLAMQKSDELAETAAVLFQQLIALGIEPNRLYISIIKSELGDTEFWITDEDGSKVSTAFAANMKDNATFIRMFEGWKQQEKSMVIDMQGEELQNYFQYLTSLGVPFKDGLAQKRRVQDIAYFSKGFIGMASPDEQPAETIHLLERFAAVFNLTFTRFNDLKIAEAHAIQAEEDLIKLQTEKKRAEDALNELQATQTQLIQSEKMASLGELTAGIAHEIQNPLNFVNNFSEVSNELLDEMLEEAAKGNYEEVKELLNDVKQNLEKINHHGKRADGIVKGMLQHSRSSSGIKELTDINALADEYLRLAYHGLRAKDKTFNAAMKTDYDETIGLIKIMPQDMGRVILNLITNAFYAVTDRKKNNRSGFEPVVSVSTKKISNKIEIIVKDNGNGIPQKILDKIFQPFFTTKPTGLGTGLGLSLSYDIVKAHSGELSVKTSEGEGAEFIIQLPIN